MSVGWKSVWKLGQIELRASHFYPGINLVYVFTKIIWNLKLFELLTFPQINFGYRLPIIPSLQCESASTTKFNSNTVLQIRWIFLDFCFSTQLSNSNNLFWLISFIYKITRVGHWCWWCDRSSLKDIQNELPKDKTNNNVYLFPLELSKIYLRTINTVQVQI